VRAVHYFPDPDEIGPFGPAFLRLMFAHADLERRVVDLQDAITGKPGFGEQNQWKLHERPKRMKRLIHDNKARLGTMPPQELQRIVSTLKRSVSPCDLRNLLAHGHWWEFNSDTYSIKVRRGKLAKQPVQDWHVTVTVDEISRAEIELTDIEAELYQLQKAIEDRLAAGAS